MPFRVRNPNSNQAVIACRFITSIKVVSSIWILAYTLQNLQGIAIRGKAFNREVPSPDSRLFPELLLDLRVSHPHLERIHVFTNVFSAFIMLFTTILFI